jgi:hypothetical protein
MRWRHTPAAALLCAATISPTFGIAQTRGPGEWTADLRLLATELPRRHPNAFYRMSRAAWDSAVSRVGADLPRMSREQAIVALMQIVALVHDGHTSINPMFDPAPGFSVYPVEFARFSDGLFIKSAHPSLGRLAGARIRRVGPLATDSALARVATLIGYENEWWIQAIAPRYMTLGGVMTGLGLAADDGALLLETELDGRVDRVTVSPTIPFRPAGHNPMGGIDR